MGPAVFSYYGRGRRLKTARVSMENQSQEGVAPLASQSQPLAVRVLSVPPSSGVHWRLPSGVCPVTRSLPSQSSSMPLSAISTAPV